MSSGPGQRVILHADMDAFYASIEQRDRPELRGKPVIVGATSPRGVVAAASYEARQFGVYSAMPGFRARQLCPHGVFVGSRIRDYADVSDEVHHVFETFTDVIEPIALDEAFLDVTGSVGLLGGVLALARTLKQRVRQAVDLPISVGIGPNKLVAKIACTLSKPDGLLWVPPHATRWVLDPLPIRKLWGVGPKLAEELNGYGIFTIGQLARHDRKQLETLVGARVDSLQELARGIDRRAVCRDRAPKSYGEENTFEQDVTDIEVVSAAVTSHAEAVARRLRRDGYHGRTVTLKLKLGQRRSTRGREREPIYPLLTRARTLREPTQDGAVLRQVAMELWKEAAIDKPIRLLGVSVSNLVAGRNEQLDLFAPRSAGRLGDALDAINERFGGGTIRRAVVTPDKLTPSHRRKRGDPGTKQ